ncbi:hypothetical protein JTE90_028181 [Oedothorax gibbosus]|uniref:LisH domain-containing protein n=1 Tax=Oedothorax gibbosus TaxID=931172 RepID=A0AAV6UCY2_9ARAC|nr:hypothetical protein JTE90_028181 [Oedothorax gibbosus]
MVFKFFPSEIARLVLGYLKEAKCTQSWQTFLSESPDLQEYYRIYQGGEEYPTVVEGRSLVETLQEYRHLREEVKKNIQNQSSDKQGSLSSTRTEEFKSPLKSNENSSVNYTINQRTHSQSTITSTSIHYTKSREKLSKPSDNIPSTPSRLRTPRTSQRQKGVHVTHLNFDAGKETQTNENEEDSISRRLSIANTQTPSRRNISASFSYKSTTPSQRTCHTDPIPRRINLLRTPRTDPLAKSQNTVHPSNSKEPVSNLSVQEKESTNEGPEACVQSSIQSIMLSSSELRQEENNMTMDISGTPQNEVDPPSYHRAPNTNSPRLVLSYDRSQISSLSTPMKDRRSLSEDFASPKRKGFIPRRRLMNESPNPKQNAPTDMSAGSLPELNFLLEGFLNQSPFAKKLADNINHVLTAPEDSTSTACKSNQDIHGSEDIIKSVLAITEADPIFDECLSLLYNNRDWDEINSAPESSNIGNSDHGASSSNQPDVLTTPTISATSISKRETVNKEPGMLTDEAKQLDYNQNPSRATETISNSTGIDAATSGNDNITNFNSHVQPTSATNQPVAASASNTEAQKDIPGTKQNLNTVAANRTIDVLDSCMSIIQPDADGVVHDDEEKNASASNPGPEFVMDIEDKTIKQVPIGTPCQLETQIVPAQSANVVPSQPANIVLSQTATIAQSQNPSVVRSQPQSVILTPVINAGQNQTLNMVQRQNLSVIRSQNPSVALNQIPNLGQSRTTNIVQNRCLRPSYAPARSSFKSNSTLMQNVGKVYSNTTPAPLQTVFIPTHNPPNNLSFIVVYNNANMQPVQGMSTVAKSAPVQRISELSQSSSSMPIPHNYSPAKAFRERAAVLREKFADPVTVPASEPEDKPKETKKEKKPKGISKVSKSQINKAKNRKKYKKRNQVSSTPSKKTLENIVSEDVGEFPVLSIPEPTPGKSCSLSAMELFNNMTGHKGPQSPMLKEVLSQAKILANRRSIAASPHVRQLEFTSSSIKETNASTPKSGTCERRFSPSRKQKILCESSPSKKKASEESSLDITENDELVINESACSSVEIVTPKKHISMTEAVLGAMESAVSKPMKNRKLAQKPSSPDDNLTDKSKSLLGKDSGISNKKTPTRSSPMKKSPIKSSYNLLDESARKKLQNNDASPIRSTPIKKTPIKSARKPSPSLSSRKKGNTPQSNKKSPIRSSASKKTPSKSPLLNQRNEIFLPNLTDSDSEISKSPPSSSIKVSEKDLNSDPEEIAISEYSSDETSVPLSTRKSYPRKAKKQALLRNKQVISNTDTSKKTNIPSKTVVGKSPGKAFKKVDSNSDKNPVSSVSEEGEIGELSDKEEMLSVSPIKSNPSNTNQLNKNNSKLHTKFKKKIQPNKNASKNNKIPKSTVVEVLADLPMDLELPLFAKEKICLASVFSKTDEQVAICSPRSIKSNDSPQRLTKEQQEDFSVKKLASPRTYSKSANKMTLYPAQQVDDIPQNTTLANSSQKVSNNAISQVQDKSPNSIQFCPRPNSNAQKSKMVDKSRPLFPDYVLAASSKKSNSAEDTEIKSQSLSFKGIAETSSQVISAVQKIEDVSVSSSNSIKTTASALQRILPPPKKRIRPIPVTSPSDGGFSPFSSFTSPAQVQISEMGTSSKKKTPNQLSDSTSTSPAYVDISETVSSSKKKMPAQCSDTTSPLFFRNSQTVSPCRKISSGKPKAMAEFYKAIKPEGNSELPISPGSVSSSSCTLDTFLARKILTGSCAKSADVQTSTSLACGILKDHESPAKKLSADNLKYMFTETNSLFSPLKLSHNVLYPSSSSLLSFITHEENTQTAAIKSPIKCSHKDSTQQPSDKKKVLESEIEDGEVFSPMKTSDSKANPIQITPSPFKKGFLKNKRKSSPMKVVVVNDESTFTNKLNQTNISLSLKGTGKKSPPKNTVADNLLLTVSSKLPNQMSLPNSPGQHDRNLVLSVRPFPCDDAGHLNKKRHRSSSPGIEDSIDKQGSIEQRKKCKFSPSLEIARTCPQQFHNNPQFSGQLPQISPVRSLVPSKDTKPKTQKQIRLEQNPKIPAGVKIPSKWNNSSMSTYKTAIENQSKKEQYKKVASSSNHLQQRHSNGRFKASPTKPSRARSKTYGSLSSKSEMSYSDRHIKRKPSYPNNRLENHKFSHRKSPHKYQRTSSQDHHRPIKRDYFSPSKKYRPSSKKSVRCKTKNISCSETQENITPLRHKNMSPHTATTYENRNRDHTTDVGESNTTHSHKTICSSESLKSKIEADSSSNDSLVMPSKHNHPRSSVSKHKKTGKAYSKNKTVKDYSKNKTLTSDLDETNYAPETSKGVREREHNLQDSIEKPIDVEDRSSADEKELNEAVAFLTKEINPKEPKKILVGSGDIEEVPGDILDESGEMEEEPGRVSEEPEKISKETEQISEQPKHVSKESEQILEVPEQMSEEPEQISKETEQISEEPKHVSKESEQILEVPEQMSEEPYQIPKELEFIEEDSQVLGSFAQEPVTDNTSDEKPSSSVLTQEQETEVSTKKVSTPGHEMDLSYLLQRISAVGGFEKLMKVMKKQQ